MWSKDGLIFVLAFPAISSASATCYFRNGNVAGSSYAPCNINATGTTNSHSACCSTSNGDVCLASGLCLYPGVASGNSFSFFFANGCTDKNLADSSCQTFCPSTTSSFQILLNCGKGQFCCVDAGGDTNATVCCGGKTFGLPNGLGVPINQTSRVATIVSTVTATATGKGGKDNTTTVTTVGSVLGVLLAISLGTIAFLIWKLRSLRSMSGRAELAGHGAMRTEIDGGKPPEELYASQMAPIELPEHRA